MSDKRVSDMGLHTTVSQALHSAVSMALLPSILQSAMFPAAGRGVLQLMQ